MQAADPLTAPAPSVTHREVIFRLQAAIDAALAPVLPALAAEPFALLDFPDHANVGDSAIWLGELAWLTRNAGRAPALTCRFDDPADRLDRLPPGPILLHGGGNFGDVWPQHQLFREAVLARFPGRPVVQMPQSIHYGDATALARTARVIERHGAFTLLVRDRPSMELARRHFPCEARLCPDMAFALGELPRPAAPDLDVLLLLRTDREAVGGPAPADLPADWPVEDWLTDDPGLYRAALRRTRLGAVLSLDPPAWAGRPAGWTWRTGWPGRGSGAGWRSCRGRASSSPTGCMSMSWPPCSGCRMSSWTTATARSGGSRTASAQGGTDAAAPRAAPRRWRSPGAIWRPPGADPRGSTGRPRPRGARSGGP
nr:polysaccharide pyruvyl transferase family protein [Rhodobacter sp. CZR27]